MNRNTDTSSLADSLQFAASPAKALGDLSATCVDETSRFLLFYQARVHIKGLELDELKSLIRNAAAGVNFSFGHLNNIAKDYFEELPQPEKTERNQATIEALVASLAPRGKYFRLTNLPERFPRLPIDTAEYPLVFRSLGTG